MNSQIEIIRKDIQRKVSSEPLEFSLQIRKDKLISDIEYTGKRFSKLFSSDSATKKYEAMMQRAFSISDKGQLLNARAELAAFTSEMKASGLVSKGIEDRWRDLMARAKDLFSAASIVRVAFTQVKEAVSTTTDLDKTYTDLIKVQSELTRKDYPDYLERCNKKAQELATTQKALMEGSTEFSKSGYDLKTSNGLTEKSTILSNVGEMQASDSAKAIISGVQVYGTIDGYTNVVDKAGALIDKYNELGNTASITTAELARGVQSVGSVFADANTSVDEFLSLLSAGNRQYQNADSLALGLRTSALRIRGASVELEEAGEDIEGVMSTLDNQKAIKALTGVDILESDQETIRSLYDIFLDISKVYKDMSDEDQSALLDILAGKHRASAISATLNNMTEAEGILQNSLNAAGSAQREYDVYLESTEAHIQQFQAKLVETYATFMNGDMISHVADLGTAILGIVNKMDLLKHGLIAVAAIKIGQGIAGAGGVISGTISQMNVLGNALQKVRDLPVDSEARLYALAQIGESTKSLTDKNLKLLLSQKQLEYSDRVRILQAHNLTDEEVLAKLETLGLTDATKANTAANTANTASVGKLKGAFIGLKASAQAAWAAMSTLEKASVILAVVSTVWSIGSSVMSGFKQSLGNIRQKAEELGDSFNSTKTEIEGYKAQIEELHAVINNSGSSIEDVTEARKTLMSVQDELIRKFGTEKDTINLITAAVNGQTDALDRLSQKQWQEVKNEFNDGGFTNNAANFVNGYSDNIDRMLSEYGDYKVKLDLSVATVGLNPEEIEEFKKLFKDNGMEITYGRKGTATNIPFVELSGNASEVHEKLLELQEMFSDTNPLSTNSFRNYLTELANSAKDMSEQYKEMYDNYILYEEVLKNNSYRDSFKGIMEAYEEYRAADISGDDGAIAKASDNYASVVETAMEEAFKNGDTGVADYFESMYPELQDAIGQWEFKEKILPDFDISGLKGKTENDVLEMLQTNGMQDGEGVFNSLIEKATEYGIVTGDNSQKVQQLLDLLVDLGILQGEISEGQANAQAPPLPSFAEAFNSLDANVQEKLLDLAKSGEITPFVLESMGEYAKLLTDTGLSAEAAKKQILDMLSVQEKLVGVANGLDKLKSSYEQFKETGYVTAQSLETLPDAFRELDGYDLFSEIVGDPTQGTEKIQQAFNDIVREYLISQDTLSGLVNASESEIQSYIANLKDMGVTNAEEVVNAIIQVPSQENELINAAEEEYMNYLMAKDGYDNEYLNSVISKNSQLAAALGAPYKADYNNWCDLLSQKAQAYNRFMNLLSASQRSSFSSLQSPYSRAKQVLKDSDNGKNVFDPSDKSSYIKKNKDNVPRYTKEQVDAARDYVRQYEEAQNMKEGLKFNVSTIDTNFNTGYSPKGLGGSSGSGGSSKDAKEEMEKEFSEVFDWIERRIKKFQRSFDKWVKQAETAVTTNFVNKYYNKAQSFAKSQLSTYGKAYNKYMRKANAVGLDEKYAKKVRNGTINIEEIYAKGSEDDVKKYEELADNIKEYQDWYDKAQDFMDSFMETAEKLYNLPLEKATRKVDIFRDAIDLLGKEIDNETDYTKKNKKIDKQTQKEKKILDSNKVADTDTKKLLSSARKELRKNRNLNTDDGITKKERKAIRKATKGNKEVNLSYFKENSAGYKAAVKYNEALKARKKAINEAKSAQQDYNAWVVEANKLKFDNIADYYDKQAQMLGYKMSALDNKISEIESSGRKVHGSYYKEQKAINQNKLSQYIAEKAALEESLTHIKKGTDEWYDAYDQIQQISSSISDCTKETYELNDAISQLHFDMFDDTTESIKRIITEQEFLRGLFAHEKNMDKKTGGLTDAGLANLGSLSVGYYASGENATRLAAEVAELQRMLDAGETYSSLLGIELNSIDNVEKRLNEARATEQEWIKERYDNASAIHDMMEELYQTELDYLKELIDAKKEALDAEKDLHDYQRTISEKTDEIATIQKQIVAYSGDTSEEGRAKLQRLQKELDDKKDDLKETEYDRYISDQKDMLDDLYDEYSKRLEEKLEDFMALVQEGLEKADNNMSGIRDFLDKIASKNGYDTETKGLFDNSWTLDFSSGTISNNGIEQNVGNASSQVANDGKERYESTKQQTVPFTDPVFEGNKLIEHESDSVVRANVKQYIGEAAIKAKKKKGEYSDVSQRIYENKAKSYKGTGKVLSTASMKDLAKFLGVKYDNASKNGRLYKKLKSIKFPGFKKGGEVSVDDIQKQVRANGDDGIVSVKNGEGILNPKETKGFKKLVQNADDATNALGVGELITVQPDILKSISDLAQKNITTGINGMVKLNMPDFRPVGTNNITNIDIGGITMNGVNDPEELSRQIVRSIQKYPRAQKAIHATSTDILTGTGNALSIKSIR